MALKKYLKRLFSSGEPIPETPEDRPGITENLQAGLIKNREKLSKFLITEGTGVIKKTKDWEVRKQAAGLFRIDTKEASILINTGGFLARKESKITGLLRMSETDLNRALHANEGLDGFFSRAEPLGASSLPLRDELLGHLDPADKKSESGVSADRAPDSGRGAARDLDKKQGPEDLLSWEKFDLDQVIAHSATNTLAHVLVRASRELEELLLSRLSRGKQAMLVDELNLLYSAASHPDLNPHSRTRSLLEFEDAVLEFVDVMNAYRRKKIIRMMNEEQKRESLAYKTNLQEREKKRKRALLG